MYNFNHLFYFYTVVQKGNLENAARHLHISQPALCSQIKLLEGELETRLFRRSGRCNVLTDSGHAVFNYCSKMFVTSEDMREHLSHTIDDSSAKLRVGHTSEVSDNLVLNCVSQYLSSLQSSKKPDVQLVRLDENGLEASLNQNEVDLLFSRLPCKLREESVCSKLDSEVFLYSKVGSNDQKKAFQDSLPLLANYCRSSYLIVTARETELRRRTEAFLISQGIHFQNRLEVGSLSSLCTCLQQGLGSAFCPASCIEELGKTEQFTKSELLGPCWTHTTHFSDLRRPSKSGQTFHFFQSVGNLLRKPIQPSKAQLNVPLSSSQAHHS